MTTAISSRCTTSLTHSIATRRPYANRVIIAQVEVACTLSNPMFAELRFPLVVRHTHKSESYDEASLPLSSSRAPHCVNYSNLPPLFGESPPPPPSVRPPSDSLLGFLARGSTSAHVETPLLTEQTTRRASGFLAIFFPFPLLNRNLASC